MHHRVIELSYEAVKEEARHLFDHHIHEAWRAVHLSLRTVRSFAHVHVFSRHLREVIVEEHGHADGYQNFEVSVLQQLDLEID